ncbi:MAG: hypothetical protein V3T43_06390 [Nitrosomonadaceae bacterium]
MGLGKYTLGPIIATARFIPKWASFLIGVLTQQVSVGGDSDRKSINISEHRYESIPSGSRSGGALWRLGGWSIGDEV